jgi:ATP dependent DNA ligase domain
VQDAIIDGEIICIDGDGVSRFNHLLDRKHEPVLYAFDLLWINGVDLRRQPLLERKKQLERLVRTSGQRLMYAQHVEKDGKDLFDEIWGPRRDSGKEEGVDLQGRRHRLAEDQESFLFAVTPSELAKATIRELCKKEEGILKIGSNGNRNRRDYKSPRIPESVAERVHMRYPRDAESMAPSHEEVSTR